MAKFQPGQSGNPGGRPKGLAARIREKSNIDEEIDYLDQVWRDVNEETPNRLAALKLKWERAHGRPHQTMSIDAEVRHELAEIMAMTPEQRIQRLTALEERRQLVAPKDVVEVASEADVSEAKRSGPTE